jgi:anti-anti-sigma factor
VTPPLSGARPHVVLALRAVSDARFAVRRRKLAEAVCIEVEGELDLATAPRLAHELAWAAAEATPLVVADLGAVTLVDSTSLLLLVRTTLQLRARGTELVVRPPKGPARRVFDVVGSDRPLSLLEDDGDAARDGGYEQRLPSLVAALLEENAQLQHALTSRIVIEQAKGVVAERLGLGIDEAFHLLRDTSRRRRRRLHDLAGAIVADSKEVETLLAG